MLPSNWTSSYNHQYRDWRSRMLSPHPAEPMFHFPNYHDPSHARQSQGFWGTRAALAETARAQLQTELEYGNNNNNNNKSFSSSYSSSSSYTNNNNTSRAGTAPSSAPVNPPLSWRSAGYVSSSTALPSINKDRRDLWSSSIRPLTGTYYDINYAPPVPQAPYPTNSNYYGTSDAYINAKGENSLSSTAFIPSYSYSYSNYSNSTQTTSGQDVRYDDMAVGQTKHVDLGTLSEPRNKFHIPGYQGFVRGMQFQHGDTFGKTTRGCLDVPKDVPQEP